ncbi:uncharacterized protein LOC119584778 [Penaeus monodon]|uniref:uncharacterized protein LOC119584778 n=1 Tax=Penaeus monodon TaxID=6687 RepID=UPI0018A71300|nr:uncharacterized protein LOC119584778 [Penaeus monodon]
MGGLPPLTGKWRGPAQILRRLGPVSFEVQNLDTGVQLKAHLNHLKPFRLSEELSYAVDDDEEGLEEGGENDTDQPGAEAQDPGAPEDPWISGLTSFAREPEECRELKS